MQHLLAESIQPSSDIMARPMLNPPHYYGCPIGEIIRRFIISSPEIYTVLQKNIFSPRKHIYGAQKIQAPRKYILTIRIYLFDCANIFGLAQIYFAHPQKYFWCTEIFSSPRFLFVCARKLSCFMRRFFGSFHFWNAGLP